MLAPALLERLPAPSLRTLAFASVVAVGFVFGLKPLGDYDGWWHLAAGRYIVEQGRIPHVDPFSYTMAGREWIMHEWGWELLLFGIYTRGGPLGALLLKALVSALVCAAMLHLMLRRHANVVLAVAVTVLAAEATSIWINERPQVIQPLFVLAALHLMQSYRKGRRTILLWYPALMAVWVNVHGSFPLGLVLFALFVASELVRIPGLGLRRALPTLAMRPSAFLLTILIVATVACFLGPNGSRGALYPLDYMDGTLKWATDSVTEWKSPNWHQSYLTPLLALMFLTFGVLALSPLSPTPFDLVTVFLGTYMMLRWARNGPVFATLAAPVLAVHLTAWVEYVVAGRHSLEVQVREAVQLRRPLVRLLLWAAIIALVVFALSRVPRSGDLSRLIAFSRYPVKAVEVVALNGLQGNMFSVYHWGGYLIWRFYKERPVFIDGRADVYGEKIWRDYRQVSQAWSDWRKVLDKYQVQYALVEASWPVCQALELSPAFTRIYADSKARLYVRTEGPNAPVIARYRAGKLRLPTGELPPPHTVVW